MNISLPLPIAWTVFSHLDPRNHMYETEEEVPDYINQATDVFKTAMAVEFIIFLLKGKPIHIYYAFSNVISGMMLQISKVLVKPVIFVFFCWVYHNYRLVTFPWNSLWSWFLVFVLVDFLYYWLHRASHENHFLWATHQMHHSSEDYNFSTALRQGFFQHHFAALFYLPLALAVPPSLFIVHEQISLFYGFWIHTELVGTLGPFEYILNTPSHHRVHHGRNPYCIDKNYGGTFIIWDRMFGTFAAENAKVAYGLVHEQSSSNWIWLQASHYVALCKRVYSMNNNLDRLRLLWHGPAWMAESEKIGLSDEDMRIPEIEQPIQLRDLKNHGLGLLLYVMVHFLLFVQPMAHSLCVCKDISRREFWILLAFVCMGCSSLGFIMDKKWYAKHSEIFRCATLLLAQKNFSFQKVPILGEDSPWNISLFVHIASMAFMTFRIIVDDFGRKRFVETADLAKGSPMKKTQ